MANEIYQTPTLLPIVRWAQNKNLVTLKIELLECTEPKVNLKPESIEFEATGFGAQGKNHYGFSLEFLENVMAESVVHKVNGSNIEIFLTKAKGEWWSRLTKFPKAPHFLKLDFDKWKSESDDEEERQQEARNKLQENLMKEKADFEHTVIKLKTGYLLLYNVMQLLIHLYIFLFCVINLSRGGSKVFAYTYSRCGNAVQLAVALSWIEVINVYSGVTKGSWITPCMQCYGRSFAMFCLWLANDTIMNDWYITGLFMAWSGIEVIRYPLYLTQLMQIDAKFLTWLRYSIWIPLYPLGTSMEALLFIKASTVFASDNLYEIQLPNRLNFSFKFTWFIWLHVMALIYTVGFILMPHMWKQRRSKLDGRKRYKQP